ncbi:MAG: GNAT family N-acetyltransferase [Balneolaceae bacterium]|nr:GNAT family N-acetyltransferase [Balneolaceae bacterium]
MESEPSSSNIELREAKEQEFETIGSLMVDVYSNLKGFFDPEEQPKYFQMLQNVGELTKQSHTKLFVAIVKDQIAGAVIYFSDMSVYGSGGTATQIKNASGFRLLAVNPTFRGQGIGKFLINACIGQAKADGNQRMIIHTTEAMKVA